MSFARFAAPLAGQALAAAATGAPQMAGQYQALGAQAPMMAPNPGFAQRRMMQFRQASTAKKVGLILGILLALALLVGLGFLLYYTLKKDDSEDDRTNTGSSKGEGEKGKNDDEKKDEDKDEDKKDSEKSSSKSSSSGKGGDDEDDDDDDDDDESSYLNPWDLPEDEDLTVPYLAISKSISTDFASFTAADTIEGLLKQLLETYGHEDRFTDAELTARRVQIFANLDLLRAKKEPEPKFVAAKTRKGLRQQLENLNRDVSLLKIIRVGHEAAIKSLLLIID